MRAFRAGGGSAVLVGSAVDRVDRVLDIDRHEYLVLASGVPRHPLAGNMNECLGSSWSAHAELHQLEKLAQGGRHGRSQSLGRQHLMLCAACDTFGDRAGHNAQPLDIDVNGALSSCSRSLGNVPAHRLAKVMGRWPPNCLGTAVRETPHNHARTSTGTSPRAIRLAIAARWCRTSFRKPGAIASLMCWSRRPLGPPV